MPRRSAGPKLWFDKKRQSWTIVDGRRRSRTGFGADEIRKAERSLKDYIAEKHEVIDTPTPLLADVLTAYQDEHLTTTASEKHILYDIGNLTKWWGTKRVTEITGANCRAYVTHRKGVVPARRELAFLRAALGHWRANHAPQMAIPKITMPPRPTPRQYFMTRDEAAKFLRKARRTPHLARFFIIGWYTGSRRGAITGLRWSMVNLTTGVMTRRQHGQRETKKRAPAIKIGNRLMAHLKRWKRMDGKKADYIVNFRGQRITRLTRSWARIRKDAKLPAYVTPHVLRHSRASHMLQQGIPLWETAQYLGMSPKVLEQHYAHHQPDWQKGAANVR